MMRIFFVLIITICALFSQAQRPELPVEKMSPSLALFQKQKTKPDSVDLVLSFKDIRSLNNWKSKVHVLASYLPANVLVCGIQSGTLTQLVADTAVEFADLQRKPTEELTTGTLDLTLNKVNYVHHIYPSVNGDIIKVSLKEQRFDTADVDWEGRYFNSGLAAPNRTGHAGIMATTLGGAGNTSPFAKGAAWGAYLTSSDFASLLPDADSVYDRYGISVQNHSYGTAIENFYGPDAKAYDVLSYNRSSLVHVFSSGNSGTSNSTTGNYANISMLANLTGSFKMAKNIITVGAVDSFNKVSPYSSKGPAYDGRVKPDLVAFGEDGSSGAAALVSGTVALVQHAYKVKSGTLPSAALIKAVLINSADDVETRQIDYASGYGSMNADHALGAIYTGHFFEGETGNGQTKSFTIPVPSNISQLKITLVWTDTPAQANAAKALVNDLDAALSLPATGAEWLPWVLSTAAHVDSLKLLPVRKRDNLNNVEQITLDNPQAGNYTFRVKGFNVVTAAQKFAVAYQLDTVRTFKWTFPTASDVLQGGLSYKVRWQSNIQASAKLEYSLNNGPWQLVKNNTPVQDMLSEWMVPDATGTMKLKLTIPSLSITAESDEFVISPPLDLNVGFDCTDSFMLFWNRFPVSRYQVFQLGAKYLEPVLTTSDTFHVFQKQQYASLHYAVAPKVGSRDGFKSYLIDYTVQGVGCYFQSFFATLSNSNTAVLEVQLASIHEIKQLSFQKLTGTGFTDIHTVTGSLSTSASYTDIALSRGINSYRVALTLQNGSVVYSNIESVRYFPDDPVIVFPNPAPQNHLVNLIAVEPGVYSIIVYDLMGAPVYQLKMEDISHQVPGFYFSKGMYFIKIYSDQGKSFVKKLVVY